MRDALLARSGRVTLATIALAATTLGAHELRKRYEPSPLAKSFEADPDEWTDDTPCAGGPLEIIH
jgi:hypothetical protein